MLHGNNVRDVIIVHVISADAHTKNVKQSLDKPARCEVHTLLDSRLQLLLSVGASPK